MNRFKIVLGKEDEFETVWKNRDTHLDGVKGFKNFNLIKGDTNENYSLYSSHQVLCEEYKEISSLVFPFIKLKFLNPFTPSR